MASSVLNPAPPATELATQFLAQVQATERARLEGMTADALLLQQEAREAASLGQLSALQAAWAGEQWARTSQANAGLLAAVLEAQFGCFRQWEGWVLASLRSWLPAAAGHSGIEAAAPAPVSPQAPGLGQWADLWGAWMKALEHDLTQPGGTSH